jgi:hypothetical protein
MRTMKKLFAIGLKDEQIELVTLTRKPDYIDAIPFFPFWILLKLGVRLSIAKWFRLRGDRLIYGPALIQLRLTENQLLTYEQDGSLWADCLSTFRIDKVKDRIRIVDERIPNANKQHSQ